ncbi:hypothetical protein [Streptomyces sp. LN325]|uniref:hypothetical protein n=1 Tax=Streptomyces sp. LN325 TaxID=3112976 RepID=UPI0037141008
MLTSIKECGTIRDLLAGHALQALGPDDASAVVAHVTACGGPAGTGTTVSRPYRPTCPFCGKPWSASGTRTGGSA